MFRSNKSPSPASANYDFALRHERVKLFARVLKQFDTNVTRTVQAMREVAGSFSVVGESYHEVAQCVNNTNPCSAMNRPYHIAHANSNRVVESYGADLQGAASFFAKEMTSLREGEQYVAFNSGVHQTVLQRLHEVITRAKKTGELGDEVAAALRKSVAAKKIVQKKEAKYTRLGKPLTASKRYSKQHEEMQRRSQNYEAKLRAFDAEYEAVMQRQLYVAGHTMDDFLDANAVYLAQMLKVLSCLAPHGADTVEGMVAASQALSTRLGVAPEDQVACRLRPAKLDGSPDAFNRIVTPVKGSPGKASNASSHNFTSYYRNRKHRGASADQAPPTARALDGEESDQDRVAATTHSCWSTPGSPQAQVFSSRSPQRPLTGVSEPDPSPPPCPNPMARLAVTAGRAGAARSTSTVAAGPPSPAAAAAPRGAKAAQPVVPRSGGGVVNKTSQRVAAGGAGGGGGTRPVLSAPAATAAAAAPARPSRTATATTAVAAPAAAASAAPVSAQERSTTQSPVRAPFGLGTTPSFQPPVEAREDFPEAADVPPTVMSDARSPSAVKAVSSSPRQQQRQQHRTTAVRAPAAVAVVDRARSTEPFDDDYMKGVVSCTARGSLQPVNLLAEMDAAAEAASALPSQRQRHVNPLAFQRTTLQQAEPQLQPRKAAARRSSTELATFAPLHGRRSGGERSDARGSTQLVASAPPPDDATLSSSTDSRFLGDSGAYGFHGGAVPTPPPPPQQQHRQANATAMMVTLPAAGMKPGDAWETETETGGVTGRSHALSASYALDSPAYAPHLRGMEATTWEDSRVRPCSPA